MRGTCIIESKTVGNITSSQFIMVSLFQYGTISDSKIKLVWYTSLNDTADIYIFFIVVNKPSFQTSAMHFAKTDFSHPAISKGGFFFFSYFLLNYNGSELFTNSMNLANIWVVSEMILV